MTDRFLDLLRHGEVQGGACFRGGSDDPLTGLGWEQMRRATAEAPAWTRIHSSPARRCADFARHLAETCGAPLTLVDAFGERQFGAWEGRAAHQIPAAELAGFWNDPAVFTPPGGEPFADFRARVLRAWSELETTSEAHSLLVTHGGVIRVLIAAVLRMPDEAALLLEVPHACLTRIRLPAAPGRPSLMFHRSL